MAMASVMLPNYTVLPGGGGSGSNMWGGGNAYGSIPSIPAPVSTAPGAVSGAMTLGNQAYSQLPGYSSSLGNIGSSIQAETGGQLPPDVIRQLQQQAAERGIATGTGGSANNNAAYLRALGLTSLDLTRQGQDALLKQLPALPGSQISQNPNFYVDPRLAQDTATSNAIYRSAPDPRAAAQAAMAAANAGFANGRGSGGLNLGGGGGGGPAYDFWNSSSGPGTMTANSVGTGTYIGGVYYGAGQGPMGQSDVDRILTQYNPVRQAGGGFDWGDEAASIPPAYYDTGTAASATAPAGTTSGSYYAGSAADYGGGDDMDYYDSYGLYD
jgi:hypothetical protein